MSIQAVAWVMEQEHETTGSDRLVLLSIANHAGPEVDVLVDGEPHACCESWPGIETIMREANIKRRQTVKDSLKRLQAMGLLGVVVNGAPDRRMRGDRRTNLYRLVVDGGTQSESPSAVNGGTLPAATGARIASVRGHASRSYGGTRNEPLTISEPSAEPSVEPPATLSLVSESAHDGARSFESFWRVYPLHRDKRSAERAWKSAVKRASPVDVIAGAQRYADDPNREQRYTKHPATWLNADAWLNPPEPPRAAASTSARPQPIDTQRDAAGGVLDL